MAIIEREHLDRLRRIEAATLMRKVTEGGETLSASEWQKLESYAVDQPSVLVGQQGEGVVSRGELQFADQRAVADYWGCGVRSVSRLNGEGFPFARPWDAEGWWLQKYDGRRRLPKWLLIGVGRWRGEDLAAAAVDEAAVSESLVTDGFAVGGGEGWLIGDQLNAARSLAKAYGEQLVRACERGKRDEIASLDRRYQDAMRHLRSLEKDAPRISIEQGRAWAKEEVAGALTDVGTAMNAALDRFALTVAPKCAGKTEAEIVAIVEREVNRLRQPWSRMEFFTVLEAHE